MTTTQIKQNLDRNLEIFYALIDDKSATFEEKKDKIEEMNKQIADEIRMLEDKYNV